MNEPRRRRSPDTMKPRTAVLALLTGAVSLTALAALHGRGAGAALQDAATALPSDPAAEPLALVFAEPFRLDQPTTHWWRAERPSYAAGWIVVLEAPASLATRRQVYEPVLYAGDQTAERVNAPVDSHRVVAVVPSALDGSGAPALDLPHAPLWFGAPRLPEQVDEAVIQDELRGARARGQGRRAPREVEQALRAGGGLHVYAGREDLELELARVIELYSPEEADLVRGMRVR